MTVRSPLSEVLTTDITQPSPSTVFIVSDSGVEGNLTVANAITLLATKGDKGDTGRAGYTGSVGAIGFTGSTGTQGNVGYTGSVGRDGYTGSIGFTGSRGFNGSRGYTGSTGTLGRAGFTGSRGYVGSTGTQGNVGFTGSAGLEFSTATNVAGGAAGTILIQRDTSSTAFISTGTVGDLLQYQANNTATWVSTSTITVNKATNSDKLLINALTSSEITPTKYITMASGVSGYYSEGAISDLSYHTNNKTLTSPGINVSAITSATSTLTGALVVAGGIGVAGDLFIGGTITANKLVIQYTTVTNVSVTTDDVTKINNTTSATSTTTGALVVQGGVGIGGNLVVGGIIYGTIAGGINLATNLAGGTVGQIPYQFAANTTAFTNAGAAGQLLMSSGASIIGPAFRNTSTIQVGYAVNLLGGGVGYLPYQSALNTTAFLAPGANGTVLTSNGTVLSWAPVSGTTAGTANTATNLAYGLAGQLPYQTAPGRTSFTGPGTAGQLLMSNGASAPVYVNTSSITVGYAVNLIGGGVGSLPYQSAANSTAMLNLGTAGQLLTVNSLGTALTWTSVGSLSAGIATTATNIAGGDINKVPYQITPGVTGFYGPGNVGQLLVSNGTNAGGPVYTNTSSITIGYSKNILGGAAGSLPYQSALNTTALLAVGTAGQILTVNSLGTALTWTSVGALTAGTAETASNIAGGDINKVPYQTSPGVTSFYGPGSVGQLLVSNGTNAGGPVYTNTSSITVGYTKNIVGGAAGSLPYQSAASTTALLAVGSAGQVLTVNSLGTALTWTSVGSLSAGVASTATNIASGTAGQVPYQTSPGITSFYGPGSVGQLLVSNGSNAGGPIYTSTSSIAIGYSKNIIGGAAGSLLYQSAASTTALLAMGAAGQVLTVNSLGTGLVWAGSSSATTTNITGGTSGQVPYQSAPGTTSFYGPGTVGQLLVSNGTNAGGPVYTNASSITVGNASNATLATNIAGGTGGKVLWQSALNTTGFTAVGTAGQIFISGGTGAPEFSTVGSISASGGTGGTGILSIAGDINATKEITAYYSSDARLKENVKVIENALLKVRSLSGVMFDWKDDVIADKGGEDGYFVRKHDTGIIAQDVEKVLPEVVATRDDGFLAVRYEKLAGLIIQAINELANEVDELKKRIQ